MIRKEPIPVPIPIGIKKPPPPPPKRIIREDGKSWKCILGFHGTMINTEPDKGLLGMYRCSRPMCDHMASGYDLWPSCVSVPPPIKYKNKKCPYWLNSRCTRETI
jgi:hypothetical protein